LGLWKPDPIVFEDKEPWPHSGGNTTRLEKELGCLDRQKQNSSYQIQMS
jgi:hypothetical protein